jgi:hypothetical protein
MLVISDIEGNFQPFKRLLLENRVIDTEYRWLFDDNHLIILGDCFDRGEQVIECLWLIYSLEEKAKRVGGYVHFILGNHEIMNMNGDWRYIHPKYASKLGNSRVAPIALYGGNNELWRWLQTKNIIEKVSDILFVHGGIAAELLDLNLSITEINKSARNFYTKTSESTADPFQSIFNGDLSPVWYRGYYKFEVTEELIDATLAHFGVKSIVTGHTVMEQVTTFFNGKIINVNTNHAMGNSEALLIRNGKFYRVDDKGNRVKLK